jgi:hypothetical protein
VPFQMLGFGESPRAEVTLPSLANSVCLHGTRRLSHGQQPQQRFGDSDSLQPSSYYFGICYIAPSYGGSRINAVRDLVRYN